MANLRPSPTARRPGGHRWPASRAHWRDRGTWTNAEPAGHDDATSDREACLELARRIAEAVGATRSAPPG
jgi:hypothetical protein